MLPTEVIGYVGSARSVALTTFGTPGRLVRAARRPVRLGDEAVDGSALPIDRLGSELVAEQGQGSLFGVHRLVRALRIGRAVWRERSRVGSRPSSALA